MNPNKPTGHDVPPEFLAKRQFTEEPSREFLERSRDLADHNNLVMLNQIKIPFFEHMKEIALEGDEEKVRQADKAVREIFDDEPKKIAEWDELMSRCQFMDETLE